MFLLESKGADLEVAYAEQMGIPIVYYLPGIESVGKWLQRFV
jgi:hypothetical protein